MNAGLYRLRRPCNLWCATRPLNWVNPEQSGFKSRRLQEGESFLYTGITNRLDNPRKRYPDVLCKVIVKDAVGWVFVNVIEELSEKL